jgi:hypothetical protein
MMRYPVDVSMPNGMRFGASARGLMDNPTDTWDASFRKLALDAPDHTGQPSLAVITNVFAASIAACDSVSWRASVVLPLSTLG